MKNGCDVTRSITAGFQAHVLSPSWNLLLGFRPSGGNCRTILDAFTGLRLPDRERLHEL
jgi:hypothetical protein